MSLGHFLVLSRDDRKFVRFCEVIAESTFEMAYDLFGGATHAKIRVFVKLVGFCFSTVDVA